MIKNYVCSLSIAKQLKEVGWNKETEFWWSREKEQDDYELTLSYSKFQTADPMPHISAPLATEILEELPKYINKDGKRFALKIVIAANWKSLTYDEVGIGSGKCLFDCINDDEVSLQNWLAETWMSLTQNNILEKE